MPFPLYFAGITQGLMWKQFTPDGFLQYPNFLETVLQIIPMYIDSGHWWRCSSLIGVLVMAYNLFKTTKLGTFAAE